MNKHIGYIGLGKMGMGQVVRLSQQDYHVHAYDVDPDTCKIAAKNKNVTTYSSVNDLVSALPNEGRIIWIMIPHQHVADTVTELKKVLTAGDTIFNGGNSHFAESQEFFTTLATENISYIDVGVSGGPGGAREGACLMVGNRAAAEKFTDIFTALATKVDGGYAYEIFDTPGAGHFVKMIHNGIEYGMMQAIAEGFAIMKNSDMKLSLSQVAKIYSQKSVIDSRLISWLHEGLLQHGEGLPNISGEISHSGEGKWTVETAKTQDTPVPVIEASLQFRINSVKKPTYTGKIVSLLRHMFGGHNVDSNEKTI